MKKKTPITLILVLLLTSLACSISSPGKLLSRSNPPEDRMDPPPGENTAQDDTQESQPTITPEVSSPTPTTEAEPVYVTYEADGESANAARIGPEGGSLTATSGSGTTFHLEIPAGALLSTTEISMTPIRSMQGLPPGGEMAASVLLEPEGLALFEPAVLTIDSLDPQGSRTLYGFTTYSGGEDPHLLPSSASDTTLRLRLTHFSSPGVVEVTDELVWEIEEAFASSRQESQAVTKFLQAQENLSGNDLRDAYISALINWSVAVKARLENAALNPDRFLNRALADYISWKAWIRIMDGEGSFSEGDVLQALEDRVATMDELAAAALNTAMDQAAERCVQNKDVNQALQITRWALIAHRLDLFGLDGLKRDASKELVKNCVRFRALFTSTYENEINIGEYYSELHADFPIELEDFDINSAVISGVGPLQYQYARLTVKGETCRIPHVSGELRIELSMDFNLVDSPGFATDKVSLRYTIPKPPKEALPCGSPKAAATTYWTTFHLKIYSDKKDGRFILIESEARPTGGGFFTETLTGGKPSMITGEDVTEIGLIHDPQK